jgi:hypothetical protein
VGGIDPRGAAWSASNGGLRASISVRALRCGSWRGAEAAESGPGGGAEAEKRGAECFFAPTRGRRTGSRSYNLVNLGTWSFHGAKLDGPDFFFFGMGSDAVSRLVLFSPNLNKTEVIMRMSPMRCV